MDINHNLVTGCPLCNVFLDIDNSFISDLHYMDGDSINNSDFVIVSCKTLSTPMIVVRDHVPNISNDLWGKMLYICRKEYGNNIRLKSNLKFIPEHFHAHIIQQ